MVLTIGKSKKLVFMISLVLVCIFLNLTSANAETLNCKSYLEEPVSNSVVKDKITISGWAVNSSGVKQVKVYLDWKYVGDATIGYNRQDIGIAYKTFPNADKSGYIYNIDLKDISTGKHTIMVQPIGYDGSIDQDCDNIAFASLNLNLKI